jgi:hypothetical protein
MIEVIILYSNKTWESHSFVISQDDQSFLYEECSKYEYKTEEASWFEREYFNSKADPRLLGAISFVICS